MLPCVCLLPGSTEDTMAGAVPVTLPRAGAAVTEDDPYPELTAFKYFMFLGGRLSARAMVRRL
jgi:hypothetical protein